MKKIAVGFKPAGCIIQIEAGKTILDVAREFGLSAVNLASPCGGQGLCGCCRVKVTGDHFSQRTKAEIKSLLPEELAQGYRLACQARVWGPGEVEISPQAAGEVQFLEIQGLILAVQPNPPVASYTIELEKGSWPCSQLAWQEIKNCLATQYDLGRLKIDPELYREKCPVKLTKEAVVTVREREIINCFFGSSSPPPVGLAVDLGTTKIAGYLINLESGVVLAGGTIVNPQRVYGYDLMSRLSYALESEAKYRRLNRDVIDSINHLAANLAGQAGLGVKDIVEAVVAGNTAMHHLFLRLPVDQLSRAPYLPVVTTSVEIKAREIGLVISPGAYVYVLPPVAGFVGGDHVAMILGSQLDRTDKVSLGLDIGTNTEIVLCYGGRMRSCSCASGPAFEGTHIRHGVQAVRGAIRSVRLGRDGLEAQLETVGGTAPLGICGSGILDAVAELYRTGVITRQGRLNRSHPRVRLSEMGLQYTLVPASKSGTGKELVITQQDIEEIMLAKAAIATGIRLMLQAVDLTCKDIQEVVVAGAFGTQLKVTSAMVVGMFPNLSQELFRQVGNAAGAGSQAVLVSLAERRRAEKIAAVIEHLELSTMSSFQEVYFSSLTLPPLRNAE